MTLDKQNIYISIGMSIILHLGLFALLFFTKIDLPAPTPKDLVEIVFIDRLPDPIVIPPPIISRQLPIPNLTQRVEQTTDAPPQHIDIPTVRTPAHDPVDISHLPDRADRNVVGADQRAVIPDAPGITTPVIDTPTTPRTEPTPVTPIGVDGIADDIRQQLGSILEPELIGDVLNRTVISRQLPTFPEGITRHGTVTLHFTVHEDGSVRNIRTVRRDEPEFERVAIAALREWRFNRSTRSHTGQITFTFTLM